MQIVLLIPIFLFNIYYAQIGAPCYDFDIGQGFEHNGTLTGIKDCNSLCIGLDVYILATSQDNQYGCLCDPNQNNNLGLIQCNHESEGLMVDSVYVDLYCYSFNYQNGECFNPENIIFGDITLDEQLNIIDSHALVNFLLNKKQQEYEQDLSYLVPTQERLVHMDTNNDLIINTLDICGVMASYWGTGGVCSCSTALSSICQEEQNIVYNNNIVTLLDLSTRLSGLEFLIKHQIDFDIDVTHISSMAITEYRSINDTLTYVIISDTFNLLNIDYELFTTNSDEFSIIESKGFHIQYVPINLINFPNYFEINCNLGDIYDDGEYNVLDVLELADCVLGLNCSQIYNKCVADINQDDGYNILDIVLLVECILDETCGL